MTNNPLKLKDRQLEILMHLYRFRFLNRVQIQKLLNHKNHTLVIQWLNELTEQKYLYSFFKKELGNIPTIYCLGSKSRKVLMGKDGIKEKLLKRVYQEKKSSQSFKNHCMCVADIYLSLTKLTDSNKAKLTFYTNVDLTDIKYLPLPHPDAFFSIKQKESTKRYFLDVFNPGVSNKWIYKRIKQYFKYYDEDYWQEHNKNPFPEIIFVYYDLKTKIELEKIIKRNFEEEQNLKFSLLMVDDLVRNGISKKILQRIKINSD
jgi:hypothetical protein